MIILYNVYINISNIILYDVRVDLKLHELYFIIFSSFNLVVFSVKQIQGKTIVLYYKLYTYE